MVLTSMRCLSANTSPLALKDSGFGGSYPFLVDEYAGLEIAATDYTTKRYYQCLRFVCPRYHPPHPRILLALVCWLIRLQVGIPSRSVLCTHPRSSID